MRWVIEIFFGLLLLPFAIILGLFTGVTDFYSSFHEAINKKLVEGRD